MTVWDNRRPFGVIDDRLRVTVNYCLNTHRFLYLARTASVVALNVSPRGSQITSADVRDRVSLCAGPDPRVVNDLNGQMRDLLDGRLVEFCSKERNTLLHEVRDRNTPTTSPCGSRLVRVSVVQWTQLSPSSTESTRRALGRALECGVQRAFPRDLKCEQQNAFDRNFAVVRAYLQAPASPKRGA
eukprot:6160817-Pyramimonas_sp.AAC.1